MARVEVDSDTGCWCWTGAVTSSGHGSFKALMNNVWRAVSAHKFSFIYHHGRVPCDKHGKQLHLRHSCDVRRCVNPNHLIPGTRSENMQDMIQRGRGRMQFGTPERARVKRKDDNDCPW